MTSILKTENSFETLEIDEGRVLMLDAWDNYKEKENSESLSEVDLVQRVLKNAGLGSVYYNRLKHPHRLIYS